MPSVNSASAKIFAKLGVDPSAAQTLCETGAQFHTRGWSCGTSSNYSLLVSRRPFHLLITATGRDKSRLTQADFTLVGDDGSILDERLPTPSAETLLHIAAARHAQAGAVLHTHYVRATLLSDIYARDGGFSIEGYEMLKGLDGISTHDSHKWVEIFENTQHIPTLADTVRTRMADLDNPLRHGFLIRGHGLYAWGRDLSEARRHVEIFEFLFEVLGRKLSMGFPLSYGGPE